jgi:KTSC domain
MRMIPLNSSFIQAAGYDLRGRELHIRKMKPAATLVFFGVDLKTVRRFFTAKSHGKFFNKHIRGRFRSLPAKSSTSNTSTTTPAERKETTAAHQPGLFAELRPVPPQHAKTFLGFEKGIR